jgi:hypothetical protein
MSKADSMSAQKGWRLTSRRDGAARLNQAKEFMIDTKKPKKRVGPPHDPHKHAKDVRRTFEHLGRVQAIASLASAERDTVALLTSLADDAFKAQSYKNSADLLRAAEHVSFAAMHTNAKETVGEYLEEAIKDESDHLLERAEDHQAEHPIPKQLRELQARLSRDGKAALRRGEYRAALELARGAETLSHVHELATPRLHSKTPPNQLRRA